jgi:hypothetical protein
VQTVEMPAHIPNETGPTPSLTTPEAELRVADEWVSVAADAGLKSGVSAGQASRTAPGDDLVLNIGWDRFEKLMLAVCKSHLGLYGIKFRRYGTQGQMNMAWDC